MTGDVMIKVPNEHGGHVEFDGELIATASSDDGRAQRWTELRLYRTSNGGYVLGKTGRSVVYHAADSTCTRDGVPASPSDVRDWSDTRIPCRRCQPADVYTHDADVIVEVDRHAAVVSETAQGVVETLRGRDDEGVHFLTHVARTLLERASNHDEQIREAFRVQRV